jgi:hypothetical protein
LWEPNEETEYSTFEKLEPEIIDIQKRMEVYVELETRIKEMEEKPRVGPILLHSEGVKHAWVTEARKWKQKYGDLLNKIGRTKMLELSDFMEKAKSFTFKKYC